VKKARAEPRVAELDYGERKQTLGSSYYKVLTFRRHGAFRAQMTNEFLLGLKRKARFNERVQKNIEWRVAYRT
jgi:hypothetical protein